MSELATQMMALRAAVSTLSDQEMEISSHPLGEVTIKTAAETLWVLSRLIDKKKVDRDGADTRTIPPAQD